MTIHNQIVVVARALDTARSGNVILSLAGNNYSVSCSHSYCTFRGIKVGRGTGGRIMSIEGPVNLEEILLAIEFSRAIDKEC